MLEYQSLYRRYRPQRFDQVRGQDHVVRALRNAVRDGRVAHAYLFSGPRGTGKTSTARILAKALNCAAPVEGEPCGKCDSCLDITRGASFDVHELDAASNNGVDAMRDLVARAALATPGRWKVYIVDEVHMLSPSASNALLKTLEEPPDHVVFVLATTDPQKVLPTIRSRTQHYEFYLLDSEVLARLLSEVADDARLDLPETAVESAVRRGRGSARDALSALDQVAASGVVEDDGAYVHELLVSLAERDTPGALAAIDRALVSGRDAPRIAAGLLDELRAQFLASLAPARANAPRSTVSPSAHGGLLLGAARGVRAMEVLGTAMVAMRDALDPRVTLEVAIVRLTHPEADDDPGALLERLERLERRVQELSSVPVPPQPSVPPPTAVAGHVTPRTPPSEAAGTQPKAGDTVPAPQPGATGFESRPALGAFAAAPPAGRSPDPPRAEAEMAPPVRPETAGAKAESWPAPPSRDELVQAWGDFILNRLRPRVRAVFAVGRFLANDDESAVLALPNSAHVERAMSDRDEVAEALASHFGRPVRLRLVAESEVGTGRAKPGARPVVVRDGAGHEPVSRLEADSVAELAHEEMDPDDLDPLGEQVPGDATSWAEERVMQVFPGAEEV